MADLRARNLDQLRWSPPSGQAEQGTTAIRARNVKLAWVITAIIVLFLTVGGSYVIHQAQNSPAPPALPAPPPHAAILSQTSTTDMLQGNFVLTEAVYRTALPPRVVIAYYRSLLKSHKVQVGGFDEAATSTQPYSAPEALQHVPPIFESPTAGDPHAAQYVYTQYSQGYSDVAVAVDTRYTHGPTLVYMEELTQPT